MKEGYSYCNVCGEDNDKCLCGNVDLIRQANDLKAKRG